MPFVLTAVQRALSLTTLMICNSDRESLYKSAIPVIIARSAVESVWITEEMYLRDYTSPREALHRMNNYFEFYKQKRIQKSIDYHNH